MSRNADHLRHMKFFKAFKDEDAKEAFFVNFIEGSTTETHPTRPTSILHKKGDKIWGEWDPKSKTFFVHFASFWKVFREKFHCSDIEMHNFFTAMLTKHLNYNVKTVQTLADDFV